MSHDVMIPFLGKPKLRLGPKQILLASYGLPQWSRMMPTNKSVDINPRSLGGFSNCEKPSKTQ